jgi:Cys-tRNA(Pro)/Cys-tRNA(Cys) deacylase
VEDETPGMRALADAGFSSTIIRTAPPTSPEESAALQGIDLRRLIRTIVVRRGQDDYVFVLVPAGRQIDWPRLRSHLGVHRLSLPGPDEARAATGYERGAITPLGATTAWPVVADATIPDLGTVAIGAGARGVNVHASAVALLAYLDAVVADVTRPAEATRS